MQHEPQVRQGTSAQQPLINGEMIFRVAGVALIVGAVSTTVFNVLFPRPGDPSDTAAVLTTMADNEARR